MQQIINIETNKIFYGQLDNELVGVEGYPYRLATQEEIDAWQAQQEQAKLNQVCLSRADFFEKLIELTGQDQTDVEAIVEQMPESTPEELKAKKIALNRVKNSLHFYRVYPLVDQLGAVLGLTTAEIDSIFGLD